MGHLMPLAKRKPRGSLMIAKQHRSPRYVDIFVDVARMRAHAAAYDLSRAPLPSEPMLRFGPVLAAAIGTSFAVCVLATVVFSSFPDKRTDALGSNEKYAQSERMKRNTEALRRSRAWWENYGRRHLQARRSVDRSTMATD
jgi:hypothetical protein